ncbi:MAG: TIM barrel protein, partial [Candidatus Dormibacteraeota bacterium]|nr:TIM barrel protein [Candidatus Dormibacteraeota bacterium]
PYGYLPTDPGRLREELDRRGIRVSGGGVAGGLHRAESWEQVLAETRKVSALVGELEGRYLIFLPEMYRDISDGRHLESAQLDADQWQNLVRGVTRLGKIVREEYGLSLVFHHHADSHVETQEQTERFLDDTDPEGVSLCLDTGHLAYCGGDSLALLREYPQRIGCLHLKQVDPRVLHETQENDRSFGQAVARGVMCEPPLGAPDLVPILEAADRLDADLFAIVEQDLYPCDPELPLPIAKRTRDYLSRRGLGPAPRKS